ncbi:hypothetical protein K458DRAFT_457730 [Lentithecium fluviatile CBS 122367]|uniref:Uncharacterized protein n=1 Tax=Lentithecium fluviatile CBS 122367 TaxID=1168545 RepID=A0A6G1IS99_9PLEO|nr:hypothetical protein K458DRAFT_457730 [Lentithecium fluviatile CBS 122367]
MAGDVSLRRFPVARCPLPVACCVWSAVPRLRRVPTGGPIMMPWVRRDLIVRVAVLGIFCSLPLHLAAAPCEHSDVAPFPLCFKMLNILRAFGPRRFVDCRRINCNAGTLWGHGMICHGFFRLPQIVRRSLGQHREHAHRSANKAQSIFPITLGVPPITTPHVKGPPLLSLFHYPRSRIPTHPRPPRNLTHGSPPRSARNAPRLHVDGTCQPPALDIPTGLAHVRSAHTCSMSPACLSAPTQAVKLKCRPRLSDRQLTDSRRGAAA